MNNNMKTPIWVLSYLIDQDEWWPSEAPHKIRYFADVHTYCFTSEKEAEAHRQQMKNPDAYRVKKTYLQTEWTEEKSDLRAALEEIIRINQVREFTGNDKSDGYGDSGWIVYDGQYAKLARAALQTERKDNETQTN